MNKAELITLLRDPSGITSSQIDELDAIVKENPYFLSGRLLLAKGSKELKNPHAKKRIASAAVYSTDRILLKKYLSGDLYFLSKPEQKEVVKREKVVTASQLESKSAIPPTPGKNEGKRPNTKKSPPVEQSPSVPSIPSGDLDAILEELKQDMENLKSSRAHFVEVQHQIEEENSPKNDNSTLESDKPTEDVVDNALIETIKSEVNNEVESTEAETTTEPIEPAKTSNEEANDDEEILAKLDDENQKVGDDSNVIEEEEAINKKLKELVQKQKKLEEEDIKSKESPTEEIESIDSKQSSSEPDKTDSSETEEDANERATSPLRESRFAKDATRSYLRNLEPPEEFPFFDDEDDDDPIQEPPKSEEIVAKKEEKDPAKDLAISDTKKEEVKKETKSKKVSTKKAATKESPTKKETAKKEDQKKEEIPSKKEATSKKSTTKKTSTEKTTMPKSTIVKKAKLVKSKRASKGKGTSPDSSSTKSGDKDDDGKGERANQKSIIDKFIKESPSIKYKRESVDSVAFNLAETSSSWDPNIASEYLAEIYLHQDNKNRAIEIYKALSLKYPEKKSYFADLISKIK